MVRGRISGRGLLRPRSGLTLIELVLVLSLLAILSASMLLRVPPATGRSTAALQAQQLADDLRHARGLALSGGRGLQFVFMANGYRVCLAGTDCSHSAGALREPGHPGGRFEVELKHDLAFSPLPILQFDTLGQPQTALPLQIELQLADTALVRVTVAPVTAAVTVEVLQ